MIFCLIEISFKDKYYWTQIIKNFMQTLTISCFYKKSNDVENMIEIVMSINI
jgi:hypothetical protein